MTYPALVPSARNFDPGNYPVKTYSAQDGAEVRLLYGNKRVGMKLSLVYENITDANAKLFVEHFHSMKGTFQLFSIPSEVRGGWSEERKWLDAEDWGSKWRYEGAPVITGITPGVSTVQVELVAATV